MPAVFVGKRAKRTGPKRYRRHCTVGPGSSSPSSSRSVPSGCMTSELPSPITVSKSRTSNSISLSPTVTCWVTL